MLLFEEILYQECKAGRRHDNRLLTYNAITIHVQGYKSSLPLRLLQCAVNKERIENASCVKLVKYRTQMSHCTENGSEQRLGHLA